MSRLTDILSQVEQGSLSVAEAERKLSPEMDIGFAHLDTDRPRRRGFPEVIYAPGKTLEQFIAIASAMIEVGQDVFATRVSEEQSRACLDAFPQAVFHAGARALTIDVTEQVPGKGCVAVVCAGTSDLPVAEEAALTASRLGANVERICDVGVAGLHRLLKHIEALRQANAVIVVAGMEGALPSVVGGLIDRPLIAVPTSVGYGTGLKGMSALLTMLNTCVPGISVVNIDNGFGAGVCAGMINRIAVEAGAAAESG